ncbi:P-loop containing nucleoside triphosphate hydrolase protein [Limtongia smithiae]|uniref:P-loop containing nucleoside triphosphate hydrolase protein n=1 Tax=Limtongia smithiae TaxID=1125753 RepID=UPI0034CFF02E
MSLWVDKYRPKSLDALTYHPDLSERLASLAASGGDFPHLLVFGPSGAGKKTRVVATLRVIFGPGVYKLKIDSRVFPLSSGRKLEFNVVSSVYHMEITPSDMGNNDRLIIQELLKEVAQTQQVDQSARQRFKVVVINEADSLTRDAQAALRRTMEKYSPNLRLILLANSTSNIIAPIRSRTLLVRVPAPTREDISRVLAFVAKKEKLSLPIELADKIAEESRRNLRRALLTLESLYAQNDVLDASTVIPVPDWEVVINSIADDIIRERSAKSLLQIRAKYYDLLAHCIPADILLKTLVFKLLPRVDGELKPELVYWASFYEHRIHQGSKVIFHLEAFTAKFMRIMEIYFSALMED